MNIKIPVSWLREYLKTEVAAKTLANYLSLCGPSVERIEKYGQDLLFDIEITSNRPDVYSVFGLAREAYSILSAQNQKASLAQPKGFSLNLEPDVSNLLPLDVIIKNRNLCPRFTAIVIDNVKIKPSPALVRNRLKACGIRPIDNIVDISNYIMLELGQPMHTFDYDKIKGHKMILRPSKEGEKLKTLDGQNRKLPTGSIVIEDQGRLIDLCGIMGGANSQISRRTKRVILFVQAYNPTAIRKTTQALAFRTEAASRFEKSIDIDGILPALSRAVYLAKKFAGAKIASELIDIYKQKVNPRQITLKLNKLNEYLGTKISSEKTAVILKSLGFETKLTGPTIIAKPPSWRREDMVGDVDLIEEIARIYGYWHLSSILPAGQIPKTQKSEFAKAIELKNSLKYLGFTEIISYSIISKEFLELANVKNEDVVELANPLTSEWQFMRPTLLVSLIQAIAKNLPAHSSLSLRGLLSESKTSRQGQNLKKDLKLFEIAKTYLRKGHDLPKQDLNLSVVISGADFFQIKGVAENILDILNLQAQWQKPSTKSSLFENDQAAQIKVANKIIGTVGILKAQITNYFEIDRQVAGLEINLSQAYSLPIQTVTYKPIPKYPPVIEDISAIVDQDKPIADIISEVKKAGIPLVKNVGAIDIFTDPKIGTAKKSVTLRLTYQKPTGTPSQEEVTVIREKIASSLEKTFKAQIRK